VNPFYLYICGYLCLCGFWCLGYGGTTANGTLGGLVAITLVLWGPVVVAMLVERSQEYRNDEGSGVMDRFCEILWKAAGYSVLFVIWGFGAIVLLALAVQTFS